MVLVYDLVWTIGIPIALVVLTCTIMERAELYKMYIRYLIPREYSEHGSVVYTVPLLRTDLGRDGVAHTSI